MENRIIKFRAWDASTNIMHYPDDSMNKFHTEKYNSGDLLKGYDIVMQFIGLLDGEGKEIYEWDIINDHSDGANKIVKWSNQNASFYLSSICAGKSYYKEFAAFAQSQSDGAVRLDNATILGNIYQTPDLIEQLELQIV